MGEFYYMGRIIVVPQFPSVLRYQEWWIGELAIHFRDHFDEVITLTPNVHEYKDDRDKQLFSPIKRSITFEHFQIIEFLNLLLYDDDVLFVADISYPGFFSNILYHKPFKNAFAFCHGTSKNALDYFCKNRYSKWFVESGHSRLFKKVFVATEYHKRKLGWKNIEVVGLPDTPYDGFNFEKKYDVISVARPTEQKVTKKIEDEIEKEFGKIIRPDESCNTWGRYYKFLSQGKVLLSTAKEETFGYPILEAIKNNTIPIAPDRFSYPELLPKKYLYNNVEQLKEIIRLALDGKLEIPQLVNQGLVSSFFNNICSIMKRESDA